MKQIKNIRNVFLTSFIAAACVWSSCNDADYNTLDTHVFFEEALTSSSTKVTVMATGETNVTLNVHISDMQQQDNSYTLAIDQAALDTYNKSNGTNYIALPETHYTLPDNVTIKAGAYNADPISIQIKAFSEEMNASGESYALPVRLVAKDGSKDVMPITGSLVILANSIMEFSAPQFIGSTGLVAKKFSESPETYNEFTVEVRFQVSNTANRNRAVFSTSGSDGKSLLLRFEDPQSDNDNFKAHSLVQIQTHETYLNPTYSFEPNKWQHLAVTYNGSKYRIYINGKDGGSKDVTAGPCIFGNVGWFSSDSWWSGCKILVSEARIWSVCRSEVQIQNNMTITSPKSPGLEAYWKFNEGKGNVFEDATGKGHTITTDSNPVWIDHILSTDEATPWK